jgi:phosphoglycerol transferase MdoB-like AlkP superfamily enzyme
MNKKVNTILFILGGTVFNVLVTVLVFLLLLIIYAKLGQVLPEAVQMWSFPFIFLVAMAVAFIAYRYTLRLLLKKIDMEKYFDPLFVRKQRKG